VNFIYIVRVDKMVAMMEGDYNCFRFDESGGSFVRLKLVLVGLDQILYCF
jgi:hypothetical protein